MAQPAISFGLYDDMKLYISAERFFLEPTVNPQEVLVIDRISCDSSIVEKSKLQLPVPASVYKPICGFLGTIRLISGNYLIVATHRIYLGRVLGHAIYQLAGTEVISYSRTENHLTQKQMLDNEKYVHMVKSVLDTPGLYFSYDYDITHTVQNIWSAKPDFQEKTLLARADPTFLWNGHLLKDFKETKYNKFALQIIEGFVSIKQSSLPTVNGPAHFTWTLLSRRCVHRAGTRLFTRGIDVQFRPRTCQFIVMTKNEWRNSQYGHVANYVETEQIVEFESQIASFVQNRGSIPLYWQQLPDLRYKPSAKLDAHADHASACGRHLRSQRKRYGPLVMLNLVDHRGFEGNLEQGFANTVAGCKLEGVRYESFDFHSECRGMRYDRLNILMDRVAHEQDEHQFFLAIKSRRDVMQRQNGVFRTNCVDCLDRTNVLQSLLARKSLKDILKLVLNARMEDNSELEAQFKTVWADHADMISVQYSGTGALKTDFTRTGKRTKLGLLRDGINSLTRYYKNNFCDGFRQDSIDLFLGNYLVGPDEGSRLPCPLRKDKDWKYVTFPSILVVAMSMFFASAALPSEYSTETLLYLLFWGAMVGTTASFIFRYGKEFVDYPKLVDNSFGEHPMTNAATGL